MSRIRDAGVDTTLYLDLGPADDVAVFSHYPGLMGDNVFATTGLSLSATHSFDTLECSWEFSVANRVVARRQFWDVSGYHQLTPSPEHSLYVFEWKLTAPVSVDARRDARVLFNFGAIRPAGTLRVGLRGVLAMDII